MAGGSAAYGGTLPSEKEGGRKKTPHDRRGLADCKFIKDNSTTGLDFSRGIQTHVTTHIFYDSANRDLIGIAGGASIF